MARSSAADDDVGLEAAEAVALAEAEGAAMGAGDVVDDGETEAYAASPVLIAGRIEAGEGLDRLLAGLGRDAGAVILDPDAEGFLGESHRDLGPGPVLHCVADQVRDRAAHGNGAEHDRALPFGARDADIAAEAARILDRLRDQRMRIDRHRLAFGGIAGEVEEGVEQALHLVDIAHQLPGLLVVEHREAEAEAGERGPEIMADPGKHHGALFDGALDPGPHVKEGAARRADLDGAARDIGHVAPAPESFGRAGWDVPPPPASMFAWAPIPEQCKYMGAMEFSKDLLRHAGVAVSPGVGFGEEGEGYVRIALVENEQRIRQAARGVKKYLEGYRSNSAGG